MPSFSAAWATVTPRFGEAADDLVPLQRVQPVQRAIVTAEDLGRQVPAVDDVGTGSRLPRDPFELTGVLGPVEVQQSARRHRA